MVKLLAGENKNLAQHLKMLQEREDAGHRNQLTLLSNNFVNNSLFIIRNLLVHSIVDEIDSGGRQFGLMMDGSQDITFQEQIALVVRYVDKSCKVVERTISFFNATKTTGRSLYELLRTKLNEIGLNMRNVVGCSFDGASNMSGEYNGVISFIQEDNPYCFFSWCLSHRFNLCVTSAVGSSTKIKQILLLAEDSAKIFRGSYKRMNVWMEVAASMPNYSSRKRLKLIGQTRWSSKQDAMDGIIKNETHLYVVIKAVLKLCSLEKLDGEALINASNNLNSWLRYDNVVSAFILNKVFTAVTPATKSLQKMGLNVLEGVTILRNCCQQLKETEKLLDDYLDLEQADLFVEKTNLLLNKDEEIKSLDCDCYIMMPSGDEKQQKKDRIKKTFRDFIRNLRDQIEVRVLSEFDDSDNVHYEIMLLDPSAANEIFSNEEVSLKRLCEITNIPDEIAAIGQLKKFTAEFNERQNRSASIFSLNNNNVSEDSDGVQLLIDGESDCEETLADLKSARTQSMDGKNCHCIECILKYISSSEARILTYEYVYKMYKYVATLPSTQVKCERDFSRLKLTKTSLRASLCEKSLENLILISAEARMFQDIGLDDIVNKIVASSSKISLYVNS